jgi:hypothetical protein
MPEEADGMDGRAASRKRGAPSTSNESYDSRKKTRTQANAVTMGDQSWGRVSNAWRAFRQQQEQPEAREM